ncbi:MAG: hypothetical protein RL367_682 [Pseudomonadota bacterium]
MTSRLTSAMQASLLIRRVSGEGGMAMILAKGDETAGGLLLATREKGRNSGLYERILCSDGQYLWQRVGPQDIDGETETDLYIQRRCAFDPDLWVIELDIPNAERFAAEITAAT